MVGESSVLFDALVDAVGSAYLKDSGGSTSIAFFFEMGRGFEWMNSTAPRETIATEATCGWLRHRFPAISRTLIDGDGDIG
jgi:hypothetical protein